MRDVGGAAHWARGRRSRAVRARVCEREAVLLVAQHERLARAEAPLAEQEEEQKRLAQQSDDREPMHVMQHSSRYMRRAVGVGCLQFEAAS